jgi:signal transduction histidine kinase
LPPKAEGGARVIRLSVTARIAVLSIALVLASNLAVLAFVRHHARVGTLERALVVGLVVSVVCGAAGGWIVSRYVARRLGRISAVIERVGEGDLARRVPIESRGDAFDRLSDRLNRTLDKVEALMGELRVVTDGLAHDLRSPLARLRAKTEQAVLQPEGPGREAALGGLLAECDLIMRMLTTLIEISRAEQVSPDRFVRADPADLIGEIADLYEPLAEDAGFAFAIENDANPVRLPLHRELLSQAVTNLVDNALKHGAAGGTVLIRLRDRLGMLAIEVIDRGHGIAPEDRAMALRRFGRLDAARSTPGAGLGMALVDAVARLHGGRFELDDARPGLVARILLPL